jgi:thiamine phosphate synthase YjbQ (UPF0047 family)
VKKGRVLEAEKFLRSRGRSAKIIIEISLTEKVVGNDMPSHMSDMLSISTPFVSVISATICVGCWEGINCLEHNAMLCRLSKL